MTVDDFGEADGVYSIAMECLQGETLVVRLPVTEPAP